MEAQDRSSRLQEWMHQFKTTPSGSIAALAGMAAAGAAGVAAAVHFVRRDARATFDVAPESDGDWALLVDGSDEPVQRFSRKKGAVKAGRALAVEAAPSELIVRSKDGDIQKSHRYDRL